MRASQAVTTEDLEYLRRDSLWMVLICTGVVLYLWCIALFQVTDLYTNPEVGPIAVGPLLLGSGLGAAFALRKRSASLAAAAAMAGVGAAILASMWMTGLEVVPYMLAVVVSLAGLLFGIRIVVGVTVLCSAAVIAVGWLRWGHSPLSTAVLSPVFVIGVVGLLSFLMVRNLYVALYWALDRAMAAQRNEEEARTHRGELARTLKALSEAYHRLEYISYDLARAREVAEEAREKKQRFAATVSHEMRTPLNVLTALSEMMYLSPERYSDARLPPEFRRDAREIYRSSRRLLRLIDDVLDMTRIESGRMRVEFEPVELGEVIRETLDMIRPLVRGRGIALGAEVPADLPQVLIDRDRVQQVLLNLLNNAQRYTERGSITVHATVEGEEVRVTVADTGAGIPPQAHEDMFKEFYQVEGLVVRSQAGHGLGLAVCRRFVEMHGGRIWMESDGVPGHGSQFHFTLPVVGVERVEVSDLLERPKPVRIPTGRGRPLLLLDRDPAVLRVLEQELEEYRVVPVDDLAEAPRLIGELGAQAVVVNSAYGSRAGRRLRELRRHLGHASPPVIQCPLVGGEQLRRGLGVVDYMIKPVMPEALRALLDRLDGKARRVLVVDDDPQMARLLSRMLRTSGREYEVMRAYDGREGLREMRLRRPDLVLLDLIMPGMDGYTMLAQMREDASLRDIPVAVITAQELAPKDERRLGGRTLVVHSEAGFTNKEAVACLRGILSAARAFPGG
jgi:signal transduction histidine kinase/DNA-binding response OmpR family regulator